MESLDDMHTSAEIVTWHIQWFSIVVIFVSVLWRTLLPESLTISNALALVVTTAKGLASVSQAKSMTEVVSRPFDGHENWDEPSSSQELFGGSTKIIWGFWNTYPHGFPWLCQRALESWRLRNPGWKIIMINDSNFRKYVATKDLPSTFYSLKVQHQSDLIRLAVLIRYGGIYLDASTLVYKGFDRIWDNAKEDEVLLTSLNQIPDLQLDFCNNGLLMTKGKENPFLIEWRRRMIEYNENPATSMEAMRQHRAFRRVHQHWNDPALGVLGSMIPYHSNLWLLNDMIWHDDMGLSKHVVHLPKIRWGFFYHSMPHFWDLMKLMSPSEAQDTDNDPEFVDWSTFALFAPILKYLLYGFYYDEKMTKGVTENVHVLKFTSHDMPLVEVGLLRFGRNNTAGQIVESSYDVKKLPIVQASLAGARPPALMESSAKAVI